MRSFIGEKAIYAAAYKLNTIVRFKEACDLNLICQSDSKGTISNIYFADSIGWVVTKKGSAKKYKIKQICQRKEDILAIAILILKIKFGQLIQKKKKG